MKFNLEQMLEAEKAKVYLEVAEKLKKVSFYQPIVDKLKDKLQAEATKYDWEPKPVYEPILTSVEVWTHQLYLSCNGSAKDLTVVIRTLKTKGWATKAEPMKAGMSTWAADFMKKEDLEKSFYNSETPSIYLCFNSTKCKRVQVGTKMVEHPVYETVCS